MIGTTVSLKPHRPHEDYVKDFAKAREFCDLDTDTAILCGGKYLGNREQKSYMIFQVTETGPTEDGHYIVDMGAAMPFSLSIRMIQSSRSRCCYC